jgi:flagellar hook-associated protein 1 FlgK
MGSSIFGSLNTGYVGLNTNQNLVDNASHNISNANNSHYTRQRLVTSNTPPADGGGFQVGTGVQYTRYERIHDEFVYKRYREDGMEEQEAAFLKQNLEEIAKYYPELEDIGIKNDLNEYFNAWTDLSANPTSTAVKTTVIERAQQLSNSLQETRTNIFDIQKKLNDQLNVYIDEINSLAEQIAEVNIKITVAETKQDLPMAADLKDQRDEMEIALNKLVPIKVFKSDISSDGKVDGNLFEANENYNLTIGGFSIIERGDYHPLEGNSEQNIHGFTDILYIRQDHHEFDMANGIDGGKVGAILDLRGRAFDNNGFFEDGIIQGYLNDLDSFANGLIEVSNSLYAQAPTARLRSQEKENLTLEHRISEQETQINNGTFTMSVYNPDGEVVATKEITITDESSMYSIVKDMNENTDDNDDNSPDNDFDDYFVAKFDDGIFSINPKDANQNFSISFDDNGTNMAGYFGLHRLFDGVDANDMRVNAELVKNPSSLKATISPVEGGNELANKMMQLQYEDVEFRHATEPTRYTTVMGYFKDITSKVQLDTEMAGLRHETKLTVYNTVKTEYESISKVSIDEELTMLMQYQTGYSANAKTITTIDQMMETLLGIKR